MEKPGDQLRNTSPDALARKRLHEGGGTDRLSIELENYLSETAPVGERGRAGSSGGGGYSAYSPADGDQRPYSMSRINFEEDPEDEGPRFCGMRYPKTFLGIKANTLVRMLKVCSAFPFVIVVAALNLSNKYAFLR